MDIADKTVVVTGAAGGIGRALALAFKRHRAAHVVVADIQAGPLQETAEAIGGTAIVTNLAQEAAIRHLIETTEAQIGPIDIFCSNAGIMVYGGAEVSDADWERIWQINLMAHVWAARHVVPRMISRGGGYLLNTASAAGLLSQIGSAPYSVTKHAAVGLAEWLRITHGDDGIGVSVLCPQSVRTAMTEGREAAVAAVDGQLEPEDAAEACIQAIREETFLVLPHEQVLDYMRRKTSDYDRWLNGMRRLNRTYGGPGSANEP